MIVHGMVIFLDGANPRLVAEDPLKVVQRVLGSPVNRDLLLELVHASPSEPTVHVDVERRALLPEVHEPQLEVPLLADLVELRHGMRPQRLRLDYRLQQGFENLTNQRIPSRSDSTTS